ncbi:hypothetical protein D9758_006700 [Tetrapyrgos nigripes]|uniref:F-box domain-containing protein n=1 Tax=Tetrapyrgos nigripes TaxID=182062 RepID=A0A8H5GJM9_9AGAR|nr:hypothetical protein D9758_006700 [Tetrapyrgos nigripes]
MSMPDVPEDIWRSIANLVPKHILRNMYEVNGTFYDLAMNERYREVNCDRLDSTMRRLLEESSSTITQPIRPVASRVRVFRMRLYFIQKLIHLQTHHLLHPNDVFTSPTFVSLFSLLQSFPRLNEYHIDWHNLPTISDPLLQLLVRPFIYPNQLRKVSLDIGMEKFHAFASFLSQHAPLIALEELSLILRHEGQVFNGPTHANAFHSLLTSNTIPSFITQSQNPNTLRSLTLEFTHAEDFSSVFWSLAQCESVGQPALRQLQSLTLSIPTPSPRLGDPAALAAFISAHSATLTDLTLRGQWEHNFELGLSGLPSPSFSAYIERCFSQISLPNLTSLSIATTSYPIPTAIAVVANFVGSLTELDLTGSYMSFVDVEELVGVFRVSLLLGQRAGQSSSPPLKVLQIGPLSLSPQLVDLLAEELPGLRELNIRVRDAVPHKDDQPVYHGLGRFVAGRKLRKQMPEQIHAFFHEMKTRLYADWQLEEIGVWKFDTRLQFQRQYAKLFARCVPSIRFPESVRKEAMISSEELPMLSSPSACAVEASVLSASVSQHTLALAPLTDDVPTVCGWCALSDAGLSTTTNGSGCRCNVIR